MAITGQLLNKVNASLTDMASRLQTSQNSYFAAHGRYWQGVITPAAIPVDGTETAPVLNRKPTDQAEDWTAVSMPVTIPMAIEVHTHNGPLGHGYTITCWVNRTGDGIYKRMRGVGQYSLTTDSWTKVNS